MKWVESEADARAARDTGEQHERLGKHANDAANDQQRTGRGFFLSLHGRGLVSLPCYDETNDAARFDARAGGSDFRLL
jgi:hypothetical protein